MRDARRVEHPSLARLAIPAAHKDLIDARVPLYGNDAPRHPQPAHEPLFAPVKHDERAIGVGPCGRSPSQGERLIRAEAHLHNDDGNDTEQFVLRCCPC